MLPAVDTVQRRFCGGGVTDVHACSTRQKLYVSGVYAMYCATQLVQGANLPRLSVQSVCIEAVCNQKVQLLCSPARSCSPWRRSDQMVDSGQLRQVDRAMGPPGAICVPAGHFMHTPLLPLPAQPGAHSAWKAAVNAQPILCCCCCSIFYSASHCEDPTSPCACAEMHSVALPLVGAQASHVRHGV